MPNKEKSTNRKDWTQASLFEINKAVAEELYSHLKGLVVVRDVPTKNLVTVFYDITENETVSVACHDFTGSWEDGGDIINDEGITIIKLLDGLWAAISRHQLDEQGDPLPRFTHSANSPLEAAMVVFLKSKEG